MKTNDNYYTIQESKILIPQVFRVIISQSKDSIADLLNYQNEEIVKLIGYHFLYTVKNFTLAKGLYEKVIEQNPNNYFFLHLLGKTYEYIGNEERAIEYYEKAIKINPIYDEGFKNLGVIYSEIGNKTKAIEYLKKAIEINPNYDEAIDHLETLYNNIGNQSQSTSKVVKEYFKNIKN